MGKAQGRLRTKVQLTEHKVTFLTTYFVLQSTRLCLFAPCALLLRELAISLSRYGWWLQWGPDTPQTWSNSCQHRWFHIVEYWCFVFTNYVTAATISYVISDMTWYLCFTSDVLLKFFVLDLCVLLHQYLSLWDMARAASSIWPCCGGVKLLQ